MDNNAIGCYVWLVNTDIGATMKMVISQGRLWKYFDQIEYNKWIELLRFLKAYKNDH